MDIFIIFIKFVLRITLYNLKKIDIMEIEIKENWKVLPISSQNIKEKNGWIVLNVYKTPDRKYLVHLKCKHCGFEKLTGWYPFLNGNPKSCLKCNMENETYTSRIGKVYGAIKVLKLDRVERNSGSTRVYYLTECTACGRQSIRLYNINQWNATTKCKFCESKSSITDDAAYNSMWRLYLQGAKDRNIDWNLTPNQFLELVTKDCIYCGKKPQVRSTRYGRAGIKTTFDTPVNGIDRINSNKGYCIDNCVTCCSNCNYMKQSMDIHTFLQHVEQIYKHQQTNNIFHMLGSQTIPEGSTSQANGDGNGEYPNKDNDIVESV